MYLRTVKSHGRDGHVREYVRIVEAYRDDRGKPQQRVICNLGRKDLLAHHLDALIRIVRGEQKTPLDEIANDVQEATALDWGPTLVCRELWQKLGMEPTLKKLCRNPKEGQSLSDRALVLVTNRLCAPTSEHGLARWLETDFVCDHQGNRYLPLWRDDQERKSSGYPRVRVELKQLQMWYRTLDQLLAHKKEIEKALFLQLRGLFSLKLDLVLYDITSSYFEGHGPQKAKHGYSRDKRPRNVQVVVGLVMVDGFPIAHHVFDGNTKDETTVADVLKDLQDRLGLKRVVFVGDRGMVTVKNLQTIKASGNGYVVGLMRRRSEQVDRYLNAVKDDAWIDCPGGITAQEKSAPPKTRVQEVASKQKGVRVFIVDSEERKIHEASERNKAKMRTLQALQQLKKRIESGRLKDPSKVGAAATRALARYHGHRYFQWSYKHGNFEYHEHPKLHARELAYEGKYVIQTEERHLSPQQVVAIYKQLSLVESAFRNLKDVIELRPIFHQTNDRVDAHIFVAALSFLLHRIIEHQIKAAGLDFSANEALQMLRTVRVVDFINKEKLSRRIVTHGSPRAAKILKALNISNRFPPN